MKTNQTGRYDDILQLSRPVSGRRARMSNRERSAQFAPFAALTGFDGAIQETGRLTQSRVELDEGGLQLLEEQMQAVLAELPAQPRVTVTWFCPDRRKAGGSYCTAAGQVKRIDACGGRLIFTDGQTIPLGEILSIALEK